MDIKGLIKDARKDESLRADLKITDIVKQENLEINLDKLIQEKIDLFHSLEIDRYTAQTILEKLESYMYIDDVYKFEKGRFIRWINAKGKLMSGGICVDILFTSTGTNILCKSGNGARVFQLKFDNNHFFQLLTEEQQLMLAVNEHIQSG